MSEEELLEKFKKLLDEGYEKKKIIQKLGLSHRKYYWMLGRLGIPIRKRPPRLVDVCTVHIVRRGKPTEFRCIVPITILRKAGLRAGDRVKWEFKDGLLIGKKLEEEK